MEPSPQPHLTVSEEMVPRRYVNTYLLFETKFEVCHEYFALVHGLALTQVCCTRGLPSSLPCRDVGGPDLKSAATQRRPPPPRQQSRQWRNAKIPRLSRVSFTCNARLL